MPEIAEMQKSSYLYVSGLINPDRPIFVDADDIDVHGLIQGSAEATAARVRAMKRGGADLYCWSDKGPEYCRRLMRILGIFDCFTAFLPKPHAIISGKDVDSGESVSNHRKGNKVSRGRRASVLAYLRRA